jgi:hypothetical protein
MLGWEHGRLSLEAAVRIAGRDRARLERLLRYCAQSLNSRFVLHCCRSQSKKGCLFLADCCRRPLLDVRPECPR